MPIYKVSFVILGGDEPGTIANLSRAPRVGEKVKLGEGIYRVEEVVDLLPPRGDFHYVHVTCRPVKASQADSPD